jgi:uncharacterized protein YwgA
VTLGQYSQEKRISRSDMLLLLLYAEGTTEKTEPIGGKTRLQKEIFLSQKCLQEAGIKTRYSFKPYKFGPYSIELYDDIEYMQYQGVIIVQKFNLGDKGIFCEFSITEKGKREIEEKIENNGLQDALIILSELKKEYNKMNIVDLVELTHRLYPGYVGQQF